jgi:hypothetical protein
MINLPYPQSVYRLLELIDRKSEVPYKAIPADLHDARKIARAHELIEQVDVMRPWMMFDKHSYCLASAGRVALAWRRQVMADAAKPKSGRPRKGESDKERLVIGALAKHHGYQPEGGIGNYTPVKVKALAKLASNEQVTVSVATVSRFFKKKFPRRGYKDYQAACQREVLHLKIALWQGELSESHLAALRPPESGREDDD